MRFQVPQFIETETKIVGPLTLYQFIWVALGVGILMILFRTLPFFLFIIIGTPIVVVFGVLAFYKIDGVPALQYFINAVNYFLKQKKYTYKKKKKEY